MLSSAWPAALVKKDKHLVLDARTQGIKLITSLLRETRKHSVLYMSKVLLLLSVKVLFPKYLPKQRDMSWTTRLTFRAVYSHV